ncbi:DUF2059 domain-containing protein [Alphaproteobacteria bacterium KMM 3653]|uniref:DUF2059 domain-containing protein n=1 Tax=Harenicola maris TaxID=2841044 RepID=A0AAP2CNK8_9RHOB|nr:DUF2059 domain-containing protein [Harenicola maris]
MTQPIRSALLASALGLGALTLSPGTPHLAGTAQAESIAPLDALRKAEADTLLQAMGMEELYQIMREEGVDYASTIETDMFPGRGGEGWIKVVDGIYDTDRMHDLVLDAFAAETGEADLSELQAFFDTELGKRIVTLEISARRALLDEAVEDMSKEALAMMRDDADPRLEVLRGFVEANDLVETNVTGALNSNFAFYQGLKNGGAFGSELTEDDMLRDVWEQEPTIREETEEWVYSYLALAYQPLKDEEIAAYVDLSEKEIGETLNRALFAAFDVLFVTISRDLGEGAAQFMIGEDI